MAFNQGQLQAINQRNASILVSAPAGSGKTKILVTRIVELLKEGYSINNFLVLTFTEAAGNEMKQRLVTELNELVKTVDDAKLQHHLQQQIEDLPNAYITNFHGFCSTLLKKYGYLVGVMPGFEILSDPTILKQEVFQQCFEAWIHDSQITDFLSLYYPGYNFNEFQDMLLKLDGVAHSIDHFYDFIDQVINVTYCSFNDSMQSNPFLKELITIFKEELVLAQNRLIELKCFCENNNISDFFERPDEQTPKKQSQPIPFHAMYDYITSKRKLAERPYLTLDTFAHDMRQPIEKAYSMSWKECDPKIKKEFTSLKEKVLKPLTDSIQKYIPENIDDFEQKMEISRQAIDMIMGRGHLLNQFQDLYQVKKHEVNQLDFNDLEYYTNKLLTENNDVFKEITRPLKEIMVDEYQDTNAIQEALINLLSDHRQTANVFMVGDMKQAIYRFRQADPHLFLEKYNSFSQIDIKPKASDIRIDLKFNYRSSKIVLDSINYIFDQIMTQKIGGLKYYYDDSAQLHYDYVGKENGLVEEAKQRFASQKDSTTELLISIHDKDSQHEKEYYEAHMVAQRILELKENGFNGKSIDYNDFAVLMRTTSSFVTFKKVFDFYHIPSHITLSAGFMSSNEIVNIMTFLKAIQNPYDNLSLLSVLKLPYRISHIPLDTIAKIRINHKEEPLYELLQNSNDPQILSFLEAFQELLQYSYSHSPYELLLKIYDMTQYPLFVSHLINGEQRKANLDLFLEVVYNAEQSQPYLKDLLTYLDNAHDIAPAQTSSGSSHMVEFMTIHKSKGLEFPIVFVSNLHKQFNKQDSQNKLILDRYLGAAIKPRLRKSSPECEDVTVEYDSYYRNVIGKRLDNEGINEEMRILYVALTRASEKLILTGALKSMDEIVNIQRKLLINEDRDMRDMYSVKNVILYDQLRKTNSYFPWILAPLLRHPDIIQQELLYDDLKPYANKLMNKKLSKFLHSDEIEHAKFAMTIKTNKEIMDSVPEQSAQEQNIDSHKQESYLAYEYPYDIYKPHKVAVTQINKIKDDHHVIDEDNPEFAVNAANKGTIVHLLMSLLTFDHDDLPTLIHQMREEQLIDDEGLDILKDYQEKIQNFIDSPIYQEIASSDYIYKEKPFSYYDEKENQTVHGIFDLVFIKNNTVYVLDYKTDRVSPKTSDQRLKEKHEGQLHYYQKVLHEMYQLETQAIVYYLHISKAITLD